MILVRNTFQVKFGKMKEALALMKESAAMMKTAGHKPGRLLTDLTGPYYTLVLEAEYESLADMERVSTEMMKEMGWRDWYQKFCAFVDSGRRELFTIVQ
jgi:hypothetical protein